MNRVQVPQFIPLDTAGRPVANGYIYVGIPDADPTVLANQKTLYIQQENGTITSVSQPIRTNAGGVPVYNGDPVTLLIDGDYSLRINNSSGSQVYYIPNVSYDDTFEPGNTYYPSSSATDQGVTGSNNTIKYFVDTIGPTKKATIYLRHDSGNAQTSYTVTTAETIPANITIEFEPGAYIAGTVAFAGSPDSQIKALPGQQIFGSNLIVLFSAGGTVYVKWWGAIGDGIVDDAQAINQALRSGAEVITITEGTYLLNSYSGYLHPRDANRYSYIEIKSDNTTLRGIGKVTLLAGATLGTYKNIDIIRSVGYSYITIKGIEIDCNHALNISVSPYAAYPILLSSNPASPSHDWAVEDCSFIDTLGKNVINFSAHGGAIATTISETPYNGRISRNIIHNGGTSLATGQNDFSAIYCDASNSIIEDNHIYHDSYALAGGGAQANGGIECHNSDITVRRNLIEKSNPAIYIVSNYDETTRNIKVLDNTFKNCLNGVYFFVSGTDARYIDSVDIHNNVFDHSAFPQTATYPGQTAWNIGMTPQYTSPVSSKGILYNISISSNIFVGRSALESTGSVGIYLSSIHGLNIIGNLFKDVSGAAVSITRSPYDSSNIRISDNNIINPNRKTAASITGPVMAIYILVSGNMSGLGVPARYVTAKNIVIEDNSISIDRTIEPYSSIAPARITSYLSISENTENPITDISIIDNEVQGFATTDFDYGYVYYTPYTLNVAGARSKARFHAWYNRLGEEVLLSDRLISFAADGNNYIFDVPDSHRCVLTKAVIIGAGDASTTAIEIGQSTATTDFIPTTVLSNIDAQYDVAILMPIPASPPVKLKEYNGTVTINAKVSAHAGVADNTIKLYGILYED